ncbi:uncharacterized protein JCM6883_005674 [Sporobolomyces salmoneus]|uniref:uncharacterized protein n=1 Tax=Sporobolomyces salmoneus TaxID=183962 RepID=UPI00317C89B9
MNNPFAKQPQSIVDQTAERYPEIPSSSTYPQAQQEFQSYPQYGQQQFQQPLYNQNTGFAPIQSQNTGFVQQAQHFAGAGGGGAGGGYPGQYQGHYQGQGQGQGQGQAYASGNTSEFDPYASLSSLNPSQSSISQQSSSPAILQVQQTQSHPRQFVAENKQALVSWNEQVWTSLFERVDALRLAWEQRVAGIKAAANQGADPTNVDTLKRDAENHVDSIHAAKMQMNEVKSGWKHSTDSASKARVREALNAGLSAMPEYPPPINPEQLGGSFHQNAVQNYQKSSIMGQYNAPTAGNFYQGHLQPQQTGYNAYGYGYGGYQPQSSQYGQQQQYF